ncbi:MAG: 4-(cytidine 5'-diphospho)-2-C-methyl-D-erythritol kinase, partial [Nitrospirales bacterium]|nr:4-(cytidine 5'-diphospho)-2-C-methyl-D-erythritol kinase [Nitrospirales bacterium]
ALMGLNLFWRLGLSRETLKKVGEQIGSDVPFFFHSPIAMAEVRGEILTPFEPTASSILLLVKPEVSVPTAWAYGALGMRQENLTKSGDPRNNIRLIYQALREGNLPSLQSLLQNDFERVVTEKYPVIGEIKKRLVDSGASLALMSGSGSAVFGVFEDHETASRASLSLSDHWNRVVGTGI